MLENDWKCILNCDSWFVSIIQNFKAIYDECTVQRQYIVLLKNNRLFCLILGKNFGNYFLTTSNKVEDQLWIYFVYFLNHLPRYEEIHC